MTPSRYLLYMAGQLGVMIQVRFLLQWIAAYAAVEVPDILEPEKLVALFSAVAVGWVMFGARVMDGITDPLAGTLSDAWVRAGRQRRTLLWMAFALPSVGLALTFLPHEGMAPALRWTILVLGIVVFFAGYTFYAIPYWSLIDDYGGEDRTARRILSNLLGAGLLMATGVVFVVSPGMVEEYGYGTSAYIFAGATLVLLILPYFAQPPDWKPRDRSGDAAPHLLRDLKIAFSHRRFVAVVLLFAGSQMSFTVMTTSVPFLAEHLLEGTTGDVAKMMGPFLGTAIPFFIFAPALSRRFGWEKSCAGASILLAGVYAGTAALGTSVAGLSAMLSAMVLFAFGGPMIAVLLGLEGEAITECAREQPGELTSLYFGVYNFVVKVVNGLAILFASLLIEWKAWRLMGPLAGTLLVVGVVVYFSVRPRRVVVEG